MKQAQLTMVTVIVILIIRKSATKLSIKETTQTTPTLDCIAHSLKNYFINITKLSIRHSANQIELVSAMIKTIHLPIIINANEIPKIRGIETRKPDEVSIIMDEETNLTKALNKTIWTSATQFIFIITQSTITEEKLLNIFNEFWNHNIVNILILTPNNSDVCVYGFRPFNRFNCNIGKPILFETWSPKKFTIQDKVFDKDLLSNLNGCVINITVVDLPPTVIFPNKESRNGTSEASGVEALILIEIAKKLNFRPNFAVARDGQAWGWIEPEPHGVVGEVFQRKSQIGFGLLASTLERYEYLDMSFPTSCLVECVSWAVPLGAGKFQPTWIYLLVNEFSLDIWCCMMAAFVFTIAALRILSKNSEHDQYKYNEIGKTILYIFQSSLGVAARSPKSIALRIVFLGWLWYSFIVYTCYQSSMGSKLTVPIRRPDINTFRDLLESNLHFTGFYNTFRLLNPGEGETDVKAIQKRLEPTDYGLTEAVDKIVFDRNIAYMRESTTFMYNAMINQKAKGLVHFMQQCVYEYYPAMVLQKRYPLTERFNKIIRSLFEAGLICKWRRKYLYYVPAPPPPVAKLSLTNLQGCFVLLFIGITLAFIAFLAEHIHYNFAVKQSRIQDRKANLSHNETVSDNFNSENVPSNGVQSWEVVQV